MDGMTTAERNWRRYPWPHWDTRELFRLTDVALRSIIQGIPIPFNILDALPPYRAEMLIAVGRAALLPPAEGTWEQFSAAVQAAGGGAGPGWLTGRPHNTCHECGRTSWDPAIEAQQDWCTSHPRG
jgi:hypothetical protein